jgi:hypothetical protein
LSVNAVSYKNRHDIEFDIMDDSVLTFSKDLHNITIDRLCQLFWQGKAKTYCGLDLSLLYFPLYYKCNDHTLFSIDEHNLNQEV